MIFRKDGTVQLKDIEKVAGVACSKAARKLASTLPGEVQSETVEKTKNYYVRTTNEGTVSNG